MLVLLAGAGACVFLYALLGDIEANVAQSPSSFETQEANRKLRLSARERPALQRKSFEADTARSSWCRSTKRRIATSSGLDNSG